MYDHLIETQAKAAEIVYGRMSPSRLTALHESLEKACQLPANAAWDQKAAAHAAFFTVMAEAADDLVSAPVHDGHPTRAGQRHVRRPRRAARP
jgi:hypothetical protein